MGLAGLKWHGFTVYKNKEMIVVKVDFDRDYFRSVAENKQLSYVLLCT